LQNGRKGLVLGKVKPGPDTVSDDRDPRCIFGDRQPRVRSRCHVCGGVEQVGSRRGRLGSFLGACDEREQERASKERNERGRHVERVPSVEFRACLA
jgi:hypothetical protein